MTTLNNLPQDARIWVYQSNKTLTSEQVGSIEKLGELFINDWTAHGASLTATIKVLKNLFVVVAVDESQAKATGCSIDKALKFIQNLEVELNLNLLDRMQVAYEIGNETKTCNLSQFEELAKNKTVNENTIVFNNMVTTKAEFDTNWRLELKDSWQNRVL